MNEARGPQIGLRYLGDDENVKRRLQATNGVQYFEPVDAREVLATPGGEYEPDENSRKMIGLLYDPRLQGLNIPQLQGADAELQTGLSHEKYGRSQVVKAIPEAMQPVVGGPQSTTGRSLDLEQVGQGGGAQAARMPMTGAEDERNASGAKPSEGLTRDEIVDALRAKNVAFKSDARKDDLADLLDSQPR